MTVNHLVEKLERRDRLSEDEVAALENLMGAPRLVAAQTDIISEHARPDHSTLLLSGFSARYSTLGDGARQITALHIAGDFVDLHSLLMKQMDHGVLALTECTVVQAPHDALRRITEGYPHLTRVLWLDTIIDAAVHRQWLVAMGRRSGRGYLAHLVCELYLRLSAVKMTDGPTFALPLTQAVLGDALGLSTVHVNRLIAELRGEEVLSWSNGRVEIHDWDRLVAIAEFDPTYLRLEREPV